MADAALPAWTPPPGYDLLLPCPFCGADPDEIGMHGREEGWNMVCYVCHVETAYCDTDAEALAAWNRRADWGPTGWRPIESAPKAEASNEPPICVLLAWWNLREDGGRSYYAGEGYWHPDGGNRGQGGWWWANTAPGDYYTDPIEDSITGRVEYWMPMPAAPPACVPSQTKE